ncbi:hypothetical protein F5Y17DRAFT_231861 [Xylariaceae sp. FL0594]|nr:hypothetical protein F5Y17DRAFT_231861 [Xylariaceae sp. FL0594]
MAESDDGGATGAISVSGTGAGRSPVAGSYTAESPAAQKLGAVKDRKCPYCGQAFTSSSLGRHLDLYIKEKNPKPPDGIHNVDAIRKMRESITRRQPRNSHSRRDGSHTGTPSTSKRSPNPEPVIKPPAIPKEGQFVVDNQQTPRFPFQPSWEATGVINNIPSSTGDLASGTGGDWGSAQTSVGQAQGLSRPLNVSQAPSRVAQKVQLDANQKLSDAMDTARAAELALRELLSSMRAAKQHVDMNSLPFDFEPLALDFPALTLQCLQAPPTLFSSTPHPNSTSWSIQPPGQKQFEALQSYFQEEFRKWRVACATATTLSSDDLTYPPSETHFPQDMRDGVKRAEKAAALLEKQVNEHLQSTYQVWDQLSPQRRSELWGLELARSLGRRQKELEKLKEIQHATKQENANLKTQIDHLNRLQQPREFRIMPPATLPIEESFLTYLLGLGAGGAKGVGFTVEERHVDLNTMVSRAIDRWKAVVVASRGGQRTFDQSTPGLTPISPAHATLPPQEGSGPRKQPLQGSLTGPPPPAIAPDPAPTPVAVEEDTSDLDADADMDDEASFTPITPASASAPTQVQPQLEVPRTRSHMQRGAGGTDTRSTAGRSSGVSKWVNSRRSAPNVITSAIRANMRFHGDANGNYTETSNGDVNRADAMKN